MLGNILETHEDIMEKMKEANVIGKKRTERVKKRIVKKRTKRVS